MNIPTYVLAPNFKIAPPKETADVEPPSADPPLQLGDILEEPFGAELVPLNRDERIAIPKNHLEEVNHEGKYKKTRKEMMEGRLGFWASMLCVLGIGAAVDISVFVQSHSEDVLEVEDMETHECRMDDDYVQNVLNTDVVKNYRDTFGHDKPLFIVSGLMIAKGASVKMKEKTNSGGDVGVSGFDLKLLKLLWKRSVNISFETSSDFILGMRLRKITYVGNKPTHALSLEKATLADGSDTIEESSLQVKRVDEVTASQKEVIGYTTVTGGEEDNGYWIIP